MDADNHNSCAEVRPVDHNELTANRKEATLLDEHRPLPIALRCQEITEQEVEALRRCAQNPNATTGVLDWIPRRVNQRKHESASK